MPCPRTEDLSLWIDQVLPPPDSSRLQDHLQTCAVCAQQLQALRVLRAELQALPSATLDAQFAARLQERLRPRSAPASRAPRSPWRLWSGYGLHWLPTGLSATAAWACGVWLGVALLGGGTLTTRPASGVVRVFDPMPPGGLCAAAELCRPTKALP